MKLCMPCPLQHYDKTKLSRLLSSSSSKDMKFRSEDERASSLVCCVLQARFASTVCCELYDSLLQQSIVHATAHLFGSLLCTIRLAYMAVRCARYGSLIRQPVVHATARLFVSLLCTLRLAYTAVCCARYGSLIRLSVVHATARLLIISQLTLKQDLHYEVTKFA